MGFLDELVHLYKAVTDEEYMKEIREADFIKEENEKLKRTRLSRLVFYKGNSQLYIGYRKIYTEKKVELIILSMNCENQIAFSMECNLNEENKLIILNKIEQYLINQYTRCNQVFLDEIEKIILKANGKIVYNIFLSKNGDLYYKSRAFVSYKGENGNVIQLMTRCDSGKPSPSIRGPYFQKNGGIGLRHSWYLTLPTDSHITFSVHFDIELNSRNLDDKSKDSYHIITNKREEIVQFCVDKLENAFRNDEILSMNSLEEDVIKILLKDNLGTYELLKSKVSIGSTSLV